MKNKKIHHIGSQAIGLDENFKLQYITTTTPADELIKKEEGDKAEEISMESQVGEIFRDIMHSLFENPSDPNIVLEHFKSMKNKVDKRSNAGRS